MQFRNILVRATNWVGDAVMSVPALQALRLEYPRARITVLARPWVAGLYGRESFCDEFISYDTPRGFHGVRQKYRIALELRRRQFDCAILLQNAFEAAALARVARIPVRIGYDRDARGWLLTERVTSPLPGEIPPHQRFYYLEMLKRAGLIRNYSTGAPIRLEGATAAAGSGREHLQKAGLPLPVIGIAPGAAYGGAKRWLPERFAAAALRIAAEQHASIAVFGAEDESNICGAVYAEVIAAGIKCANFAGRTTLPQLLECLAACELLFTNDSGPMHIASALGVPTVAVFGATDHVATGPTGDNARVVRHPVECSPCLLRECPIDHRCMTRVNAETAAAEARTLISLAASH